MKKKKKAKGIGIYREAVIAAGFKLEARSSDGKKTGHLYVYVLSNSGHKKPFALIEDIFVEKKLRGAGVGSTLVKRALKAVKDMGCYKVIMTSRHGRPRNHKLFKKLGFKDHGLEFRKNIR